MYLPLSTSFLFMVLKIVPNHSPSTKSTNRLNPWRLVNSLFWLGLPILLPLGWYGYRELENQTLSPEAIFVLGGETQREKFAAEFAQTHPDIPVWISGGAPEGYAYDVFKKAGIERSRLRIDRSATDTVSNFTTLVNEISNQGIKSVYLITADDHMFRGRVIGEIIFGSRGIKIKPVEFTSNRTPEPLQKILRDGIRSIVWVTTGYNTSKLPIIDKQIAKSLPSKPL